MVQSFNNNKTNTNTNNNKVYQVLTISGPMYTNVIGKVITHILPKRKKRKEIKPWGIKWLTQGPISSLVFELGFKPRMSDSKHLILEFYNTGRLEELLQQGAIF